MFSDESIKALAQSIDVGRPRTGPTDVQIMPTPRCNASCVFCPAEAIPKSLMKHTPRFDTYTKDLPVGLLDRLADELYHLGGLRRMTFTGGEPLLYPFLIPLIFQFTQGFPDAELTVVTNGLRLKKFASFFTFAGLAHLTVSINAGAAATYKIQNPGATDDSFDQIVEGVAAVMDTREKSGKSTPRITLSVVLTRHSHADVAPLFELGRRLGVEAVTFVPLMEIRLPGAAVNSGLAVNAEQLARLTDDVARYGEQARAEGFYLGYADGDEDRGKISCGDLYQKQPCYAGSVFTAIYPNGDVRPCCHCEPIMGNLTQNSFSEIWLSEKYQEQRAKMMAIQSGEAIEGCLCGECGYCHENREFHRLLK